MSFLVRTPVPRFKSLSLLCASVLLCVCVASLGPSRSVVTNQIAHAEDDPPPFVVHNKPRILRNLVKIRSFLMEMHQIYQYVLDIKASI